MFTDKTKKLMEQSILLAMDSLSKDIQGDTEIKRNKPRAEAIKTLAEAYVLVHRG